jgi:hypothetical protein
VLSKARDVVNPAEEVIAQAHRTWTNCGRSASNVWVTDKIVKTAENILRFKGPPDG